MVETILVAQVSSPPKRSWNDWNQILSWTLSHQGAIDPDVLEIPSIPLVRGLVGLPTDLPLEALVSESQPVVNFASWRSHSLVEQQCSSRIVAADFVQLSVAALELQMGRKMEWNGRGASNVRNFCRCYQLLGSGRDCLLLNFFSTEDSKNLALQIFLVRAVCFAFGFPEMGWSEFHALELSADDWMVTQGYPVPNLARTG